MKKHGNKDNLILTIRAMQSMLDGFDRYISQGGNNTETIDAYIQNQKGSLRHLELYAGKIVECSCMEE